MTSRRPAARTVTVAQYLVARLHAAGVRHLFGVPGDFTLDLLDAVQDTGLLEWVGTANELDAGYAADGYARRRGLAALITTAGVGELSCINAIAGSYAEQVPVVQVSGVPATGPAAAGALLHHTLCDGDYGHFARAYREVTAVVEVLTADSAAAQIDRVIGVALSRLRPVYLAVPTDLVSWPVDAAGLDRPLAPDAADPATLARFVEASRRLLTGRRPVVVAGHLVSRLRIEPELRALVEAGGVAAVTLVSSKGVLDEDHPNHAGVYCGALGDPAAAAVVAAAPAQITVGTLMSDVVSGFFTDRQDPERTIALDLRRAVVGGEVFDEVPLRQAVAALTPLLSALSSRWVEPRAGGPLPSSSPEDGVATRGAPAAGVGPCGPAGGPGERRDAGRELTQVGLWAAVERWLPPGHTVVADIGTAFWGVAGIAFPPDTVFVAQPVWSSIGYALPATLGCALADPGRRAVLVIGDGAAQMSAQELGTLAVRAPGTIVILIENGGYTIERVLQSPLAGYNDVVGWDWEALVRALAPRAEPLTLRAASEPELADALRRAEQETGRVTFLQVDTGPLDAPPLLQALAAAVGQRR
jgi:TPP-dependent 2-oxoacid decarboxylase